MLTMTNARMIAAIELRSAAWCRREAAKHDPRGHMRRAEVHEARNRIREARYARIWRQLHAEG